MGIPRLRRHLEPYAQRNIIKDRKLVIDGPAFAYHILSLFSGGVKSPYEHPSYEELQSATIELLDKLSSSGNAMYELT